MLETLDNINWKKLLGAYGPAAEVPRLLRSLVSGDQRERDEAAYDLFSNICHQGTVYEATTYAVPFLIEMLNSNGTANRTSLVLLLASIANGSGYLEVHAQSDQDKARWREILAKQGKDFATELQKERSITAAVRREAAKSLPLLISFLSDPEAEVRLTVAEALGAFPEYRESHSQALNEALAIEKDTSVRKGIEQSLERLHSLEDERQNESCRD